MGWLEAGWQVFAPEPAVDAWVCAVKAPALTSTSQEPRRHGGTWCVGVDALDNDAEGRVVDGPPLAGRAFEAAVKATGAATLHRAQISVTYPGYPMRDANESAANHRFRRDRDAAHLDGLLPIGPAKRRHLHEPHAWILGVALTQADLGASPLVVWDGSHHVIRRAFETVFTADAQTWADMDVTDLYKETRAEVFATCRRVEVPLQVGETVLLHRMTIHGVAPWALGAQADPAGRAIAYFRPCFRDPSDWLSAP